MDLEKLIRKYHNVSREELEKIRETSQYPAFSEVVFTTAVCLLDKRRENEKINGRESVIAGPLVQVLSVHVLPDKIDQNKPLTIYGRIYVEFRDTTSGKMIAHDLFIRKCDDAEVLGPSGTLTLVSPDSLCWPFDICMSLHNTRLVVDVCAGDKNLFAELFCCPEDMTDFEQVKLEYVHGELGSLALHYVAMPFAVYGHVEVVFFLKHGYKMDEETRRSLNVKGKIIARYGNTYGSYASEKCTLFEKQSNEFERVEIDMRRGMISMRLTRCWVGLPAYSSLILDLDLSEFGTERKILKETVEFGVENERVSEDKIIVDDILISVRVGWCSPRPQGRRSEEECDMELEDESSDDEMSPLGTSKEESDGEQMNESCVPEASLNLGRRWVLHAHQSRPLPSPSMEIFSVFIGRDKFKALQVYGSIQVSSSACTFYVFNREAKDPFGLSEHSKTIPVPDGSRVYDDCDSLGMKLDLKDVESGLHIRGFVHWDERYLDFSSSWLDKQLCSVIQGQHGFAAIHYTIFSEAVQANVGVLCMPEDGRIDVYPKVYGSLVARYSNYDYTSGYNKDYYRIILLNNNREDPSQPGAGGVIPLSRSMVVVPLNSSLIIEANIWGGVSNQVWSCSTEFRIGADSNSVTMEGKDYSIRIYVKWGEVSN